MKVHIGKRAFVPFRFLSAKQLREAERALTYREMITTRMADILKEYASVHDDVNVVVQDEYVTVNECVKLRHGVSVPRAWAMENIDVAKSMIVDHTVFPTYPQKIKFTGTIEPRDEQQRMFFNELLTAAKESGPQEILANATTGTGKTVAGIYLGWKLQTPTIIVVDSNKIANGWIKNFKQFFGSKWTDTYVGRAQQNVCDYKGKAFVISLAQSLARRNYGRDFYNYFGLHVIDEVQVFGGPNFAPVLHQFNARVRVGFTAENRGGSFGRRIKHHLGDTRVKSSQEVLQAKAWIISNKLPEAFYCMTDGALLNGLARQVARNQKLASLIYKRGYQRGRQVLVLSNRTEQCKTLRDMCLGLGVPNSAMGLHMGGYLTDRYVVYYKYAGSSKRNRLHVAENRAAAMADVRELKRGQYHRFSIPTALYNRLQAGASIEWEADQEVYNPTQNELDDITNSCQIIFATYEIFSKGVDVPRLDMGVEALPSGNLKQPLGRVLRLYALKPTPEWYSIHDTIEYDENDIRTELLQTWFDSKTRTRVEALRKAKAKIAFQ